MKRNRTFLLTAVFLLMSILAFGQTRTQINWVAADQGYSNSEVVESVEFDDNVSGSFDKGTNSNPPKYYTTGSAIRCYGGNFFTIETSEGNLTEIALTFSSGEGSNAITTNVGTYENGTWTGSSNSVTFTIGGTSGHRRIAAFDITYSAGGGQQTVATPTFSLAAGIYYDTQSVSISCTTEGATIRYTLDETEPTESSAEYSTPISVNTTTTIKAKAFKSGYIASGVATATYSFPTLVTIAEARALANDEYALVQGVVTFIDGKNVYIEDETGGIDLFLNANASNINLGDMVNAYGKKTVYNGLVELTSINQNSSAFNIISTGNTLPLTEKTIAEVLEGGSDALQCTRVKIVGATIGAINTGGNTPLTQGESSINIYKVPALTGIEEGNVVDVIAIVGYFNTPQLRVATADDVVIHIAPELNVSITQLSGFQYTYNNGPSQAQSFTVTGSNLTTNVTLTAPQDFEISTDLDGTYSNELTAQPNEGTLNATIYVRMKANLEVGNYSGNISITSGSLNSAVALSGIVVEDHSPVLSANPTELSGFTYDYEDGGPSEIAYFELSGNYLTSVAQIYPSESFEISTMTDSYFHSENPANVYSQGNFYGINVYVRMKAGLDGGTYNEQLYAVSEGSDTLFINVSGTVTGGTPTPPPTPPTPPTPSEGNYIRISDLSSLTAGSYVVFAARYDENATNYYAMSNTSSGKPTGVEFISASVDENEVLPASIVDEEDSFYWIVDVTANGYTFTNAAGELIGYTSGTNFATGGDNTEWAVELSTAGESAMVPNYTGFYITNVNTPARGFALNNQHNYGAYAVSNNNGSNYNFYLDLFVKTEGGVPPTPTVAAPTFSPEAGTYYEAQSVSIACTTENASIYYSTTSETGPWTAYTSALTVSENMTIWAYATKEGYDDSPVVSAEYVIQLGFATIFNQDWEGEMNGWTFVDVEGAASWSINQTSGNHYAKINAYNQGANIDWCISPAFNLDAYTNPTLSFRSAKNYTGNDIEVFISNNYESGNPTNAIWTSLNCALSTGSWTWVESGDIDLSSFSGTNCHIGFMYTSTETEAAGWEIDDILLIGQTSEPTVTVTPLMLTGFNYTEGNGPSAEQSFTVSGLNLSGNIIVSEAADYEISLSSGNNFVAQATLTLAPTSGNLEETTIYVRLKAGLAVGNYNDEDITITCADVDDIEVTCSGSVSEQPVPGDDYVRISNAGILVEGNRVILAARYNETTNAYLALTNTPSSGKLATTEFTSAMSGADEIIPASILDEEDSYYWTVGVVDDGYTFTNANGDMISYGNSGTNFTLNGEKSAWTINPGTSSPESMVPDYFGFNIVNATTDTRAFALRTTDTESIVKAYATSNMNSSEYNFFLDIFMQGEGGVPPTPTVAAPTFTPAAGTYYETQDVIISCTTADATIYYSLDSETGPWSEYEEAVTVDESMTIWAYAEKAGYNDSPVVNAEYIIQNDLTIIFNQDWEGDWNGWTQVSVEGEEEWTIASHSGNHYAYMNGYSGGAAHTNEDWLISPAFDLDSYNDVVLTFRTAKNYTGEDIKVYFSNDYYGQDPTAATWQELDCELSEGGWNWVESGEISLDEFSGTNCHIGFKYTCTDEEAAGWEIDDIMLVSGGISTDPCLIAIPNALSGFSHVVGHGPSASQTFNLTGGNFLPAAGGSYGYVLLTLGDNSPFEISLDDEEYTSTLYIEIGGSTLDTTIFVRLWGDEIGQYDRVLLIEAAYQGIFNFLVTLSGEVLSADQPTISAAMPLYIQGNNGSNNNRVPVAIAVYVENLEPNTTYRYTNQFVDDNDGPETAGAGNVIYANPEGFYRSTSPSLATEGGYGEFTTNDEGYAFIWLVNEPTANARFTPGNQVYLRVRLNDGNDGTTAASIFTSEDYATVLNFGTENDEYSCSAFYAKSNEAPMSFAQMYAAEDELRPVYSTSIETIGVDYGSINQYADFYKEEVAGKDGWFGGILPNVNEEGINFIMVFDMDNNLISGYYTTEGQWAPEANTVNPTNGLNEPIFIDLTDDGVEEEIADNVKIWNADNEIVIENNDNTHYTMTVYNILGQPMMTKQINAGSTERISHNLAAGVYVINLQNTQSSVSVKAIVR